MNIAVAQIDTLAGDIYGNAGRVLRAMDIAKENKADLCIFPELTLPGYAPYDLLKDDELIRKAIDATNVIAKETNGMGVILGTVEPAGMGPDGCQRLWNVAVLLHKGGIVARTAKTLLPSYDVFHETRYFRPAEVRKPVQFAGKRIGILICEDMWDEPYNIHPGAELKRAGAELLIVLSASPYRRKVLEQRFYHARRQRLPLVYVNAVGASDELIFDGGSFLMNAPGEVTALMPRFQESVRIFNLDSENASVDLPLNRPPEEEIFEALVSGIRGFVVKNGLQKAFVGLSGGIDSAMVLCLAKEALGADKVSALALPSRFTDPRSTESAAQLARALGVSFETICIETLHQVAKQLLGSLCEKGTAGENLQCRLRTMILMAHVNAKGGMLLNTSNKTELALGYGTTYGDLAGALSPLGDLPKTDVYRLARWYNSRKAVIPQFILDRLPTAELKPDQVDPFDYPHVSPIVEAMVEGVSADELRRMGATDSELRKWSALLHQSEHKRRQAPVILKVQPKSFGLGRLMPVTAYR